MADSDQVVTVGDANFVVRFCGHVQAKPDLCGIKTSSLCKRSNNPPDNPSYIASMGTWAEAQLTLIDSDKPRDGVQVLFPNGEFGSQAVVLLKCGEVRSFTAVDDPTRPVLTMADPSLCVAGPKGALSYGTIFLIALAATLLVYIVLGCWCNRRRKGTPLGCASCPQHDMWCGLLGLARDGCKATAGCVRNRCCRRGDSTYARSGGAAEGAAGTYGSTDVP